MESAVLAIQRGFPTLLRMSLSASILTAVAVVLRFLLRKAPRWVCCLLWALVAVRLLCPVLPVSRTSLMPLPGSAVSASAGERTSGLNTVLPEVEVETARDYAVNAGDGTAQNIRVSHSASPGQYLPLAWALGMTGMLLWALVSFLRLRRRVAASVPLGKGILLSDGIGSPFILGVFRPRICLPSGLGEPQRSHVLAHERAHLRRRDHIWKPLGFLLLSLHWFNPVLWLAYFLFCRDMELACDERAVRDMGPEARADYSQALLDLSRPGRVVAACPLAFGEAGVKQRVKNVLNYRRPRFWLILLALVLCVLAAVFFLTEPGELLPEDKPVVDVTVYREEGTIHLEPEAGEELAALVRRYGKRRKLRHSVGTAGSQNMTVYLYYEDRVVFLQHWYVSGYNLWNGREADYENTVHSSGAEWKMAFAFDKAFAEWRSRWITRPEDLASAQVYRMSEVLYESQWLEDNLRRGIDLLYLPGAFLLRYTAETWPLYCVTPEEEFLVREDPDSERWTNAGKLKAIVPGPDNFDRYYRNALSAFPDRKQDLLEVRRLTGEVSGGDRNGEVFYDLLRTGGGVYLACGYYDTGEGEPDSDASQVHFVIRLEPTDARETGGAGPAPDPEAGSRTSLGLLDPGELELYLGRALSEENEAALEDSLENCRQVLRQTLSLGPALPVLQLSREGDDIMFRPAGLLMALCLDDRGETAQCVFAGALKGSIQRGYGGDWKRYGMEVGWAEGVGLTPLAYVDLGTAGFTPVLLVREEQEVRVLWYADLGMLNYRGGGREEDYQTGVTEDAMWTLESPELLAEGYERYLEICRLHPNNYLGRQWLTLEEYQAGSRK